MKLTDAQATTLIRSLQASNPSAMRDTRLSNTDYHLIYHLKRLGATAIHTLTEKTSLPESYLNRSILNLTDAGLIKSESGYVEMEVIK